MYLNERQRGGYRRALEVFVIEYYAKAFLKYKKMEEELGPSSCHVHVAILLRVESSSSHGIQGLPTLTFLRVPCLANKTTLTMGLLHAGDSLNTNPCSRASSPPTFYHLLLPPFYQAWPVLGPHWLLPGSLDISLSNCLQPEVCSVCISPAMAHRRRGRAAMSLLLSPSLILGKLSSWEEGGMAWWKSPCNPSQCADMDKSWKEQCEV